MVQMTWDELQNASVGEFRRIPHYDADADTLTIFIEPDESYGERIDEVLSVYRSLKTKKVIGCHVKGVRRIVKNVHLFGIDIKGRGVTIGLLFLGLPWTQGEEPRVVSRKYEEIRHELSDIAQRMGEERIEIPAMPL